MPAVKFSSMLAACHIPPRGDEVPAFVHRTTGDIVFISATDPGAAELFPGLDLGKLRAILAKSPDWLSVPKFNGPPKELAGFAREWCGANEFTVEN